MSKPKINTTGWKFHMLTVLSDNGSICLCLCDCGEEITIKRRYSLDKSKMSCGCLLKPKYGVCVDDLPEYKNWQKAKQRCYDKNNNRYYSHGARGIKMCERWLVFDNFYSDMGKRPTPKHSLDRIDVNKDYTPENCKWSNLNEQARNKRNTIKVNTPDGVMSVHDAAEKYGLNVNTIKSRLNYGFKDVDALSKNDLRVIKTTK